MHFPKKQYAAWLPYNLLFSIALLLRFSYLASRWSFIPDWNTDARGYHLLAVNLVEHNTFSISLQPPFQPDSIRTPGYPFFIALIYRWVSTDPRAVLVAQSILDALTTLLVIGLTRQLSHSARAAVLAGAVYAIYPTAWRYCAEFYVETVAAFMVTLVFYGLVWLSSKRVRPTAWHVVGLGIACAVSLLIKPSMILLPLIVGGWLLIKDTRRHAAMFTITLILLMAPWVIRNTLVFGRPMLSTVFENNLARVSAPATLAEVRGENVAPWTPRWEALFLEEVETAARVNPGLFAVSSDQLTPRQLDQVQLELARVARGIIAAHPWAFATSHAKGVVRGLVPQDYRFWFSEFSGQSWESAMPSGIFTHIRQKGWRAVPPLALGLFMVVSISYAVGYTAAIIGAWRASSRDRMIVIAIVLFIAYMLVLPGPIAYERFRVPIMPLVCVFMGCAAGTRAST